MAVLQPRWGEKPGTEVGVNSSFVALITTESVSIAILWLLLPPEVGVNRHGLEKITVYSFLQHLSIYCSDNHSLSHLHCPYVVPTTHKISVAKHMQHQLLL